MSTHRALMDGLHVCTLNPTGVKRRSISYKDKSRRKKKNKTKQASTPVEGEGGEEPPSPSSSSKKGSGKFHKLAKLARSVSGVAKEQKQRQDEVDNGSTIAELPEEQKEEEEEGSSGGSLELTASSGQVVTPPKQPSPAVVEAPQRRKRPPPRPPSIALKGGAGDGQAPLHSTLSTSSPIFTNLGQRLPEGALHQATGRSKPYSRQPYPRQPDKEKSQHSPQRLTSGSHFRLHPQSVSDEAEEFFVINYINLCVYGMWLCVANSGGYVMVFDFCTKPNKPPKHAGVSSQ